LTLDSSTADPPTDPPIARTKDRSDRRNSGPVSSLQESTPSLMSVTPHSLVSPPNNRAGSIGVARLRQLVTGRDIDILTSVSEHRLLLSSHIVHLHFWNHASAVSGVRACNRVLNRLREYRLLRRLDRPVGGHGGGSQSYVWAIDVAGDRLLRALDPEGRRRQRSFEPSETFLAHTLAIADRRVEIEQAARAAAFELLTVVTEPGTLRQFVAKGASLWLKPDLEITTAIEDYEYDFFIEQDLGTESGTALIRKCQVYQRYFASGIEQRRRGAFPRVLWLMPDERRAAFLRSLLDREPGITPGLFTVTTSDRLIDLLGRVREGL
jgi:hypothetical protein